MRPPKDGGHTRRRWQVEQLTRTVERLEREVQQTREWETALDEMLGTQAPARPNRPSLRVVPPGGEVG